MQVKVLVIEGQVINRNGKRVKTLPEVMEKQLNEAIHEIKKDGGDVKDIKTESDFGSLASGGTALVVLTYEPGSKTGKGK